jgi:hypothetical protein
VQKRRRVDAKLTAAAKREREQQPAAAEFEREHRRASQHTSERIREAMMSLYTASLLAPFAPCQRPILADAFNIQHGHGQARNRSEEELLRHLGSRVHDRMKRLGCVCDYCGSVLGPRSLSQAGYFCYDDRVANRRNASGYRWQPNAIMSRVDLEMKQVRMECFSCEPRADEWDPDEM